MSDLLLEGLSRLSLPAGEKEVDKLKTYIRELNFWNRKLSLVHAEGEELIIRHVLDSLAAYPFIMDKAGLPDCTIADVGSGGGFPGIPLSVFLPNNKIFLIERSAKKADFLSSCSILLKLDNVVVINKNLEEVNQQFSVVVFRAFRDFKEYFQKLISITETGGCLAAYKGKRETIDKELGELGERPGALEIIPLKVPYLEEERHLVIIKKGNKDISL